MCMEKKGFDPHVDALQSELEFLVRTLSDLPQEERARAALTVSARILEFTAYESAMVLPSASVGEMIDWAARLDRCSTGLRRLSPAQREFLCATGPH